MIYHVAGPATITGDELTATGRPIIVAGSTHEGEEEIVLDAVVRLSGRGERPLWILAPRHPERFDAIAALLGRRGLSFARRSGLADTPTGRGRWPADADLLLLDTIGELSGCYGAARVCFVGGSLVPIGGHNLLEPARGGTPILVGPHIDSIRPLVERLQAVGAVTIVEDADALAASLARQLDRPADPAVSAAAQGVARESAGSVARTWNSLNEVLARTVADRDGRARAGFSPGGT